MPDQNNVWTVLSMLEWATGHFKNHNVPNPRLSIEWLLADVLEIKRLDLYLQYDRPLSDNELDQLRPLVKRRQRHEPLQYITGYTDFLNCRIEVNPDVLIPRSETEQLAEILLHDYREFSNKDIHLLDIGTGSGCIPVAAAKMYPCWRCFAVDVSDKALLIARKNASLNDAEVQFFKADLFELKKKKIFEKIPKLDLIVSNPPYILPEEKNSIDKEVREYEPACALFHDNPRSVYRAIARFASGQLKQDGRLYLECNARLTEEIAMDLRDDFDSVDIVSDYDSKKRFLKASKPL